MVTHPVPYWGQFRIKALLDKLEGDELGLDRWMLYLMLGCPLNSLSAVPCRVMKLIESH